MKTPILGSSYVARSVNAADNRMVNLFPEIVPEGGKEPAFLQRAPAFVDINGGYNIGPGPIRGMHVFNDLLYVVSGDELWSIESDFVVTSNISGATAITGGTDPVIMVDNGTQLFIAVGSSTAYVYDSSGPSFTELVAGVYPNFPGAVTVAFLNGFFVVNEPNTGKVWCSSLYDGLTWSATDFASAESSPDDVIAVFAIHGELWVFGNNTVEVWYNTGSGGFPFAPIAGVLIEVGCASQFCIAQVDNTLFWVSNDQRGHGIIYRADGYNAVRVSTHAVEWQIQQYVNFSECLAFTYQQEGHQFYLLVFYNSSGSTSWVYDAATQAWHERAHWNGSVYSRYRANCVVFFGGILVAGYSEIISSSGYLFELDLDDYSAEQPNAQKWLRSWRALPTGTNNLTRSLHHSLQLDCEPAAFGATANVSLRWSDDGGHSWSSSYSISYASSVSGERVKRVIWRRLGAAMKLRDRVYEVSGTSAVKMNIMGAELLMSPTNA